MECAAVLCLLSLSASCSKDTDESPVHVIDPVEVYTYDTAGDNLESFSVELNTDALTENETIPTDATDEAYEDYRENEGEWKNNFTITYSDDDVSIEGYDESDTDFTFVKEGAQLTVVALKKAHYTLRGSSSNGSLKIMGEEKKAWVELAGLTLTNPTGAALQKQSDKRLYLTVADGTANTLCDGTTYTMTDGEDQKGTVFAEGKLIIDGSGTLSIKSVGTDKNALVSDDYVRFRKNTNISIEATTKNAVKTNDAIIIDGGVLNITVSSTAGKGLSTDGYMEVNGGRTTVITTGGGTYADGETSACACIKTDSIFRQTDGQLYLKSTGQGGKGISSDQEVYLQGGSLRIITTGARYTYGNTSAGSQRFGGMGSSGSSANRTSAKGIKADKTLSVSGGDIAVRCTGGEGSEGLESKQAVSITGGLLRTSCYDDCINASSAISISGGQVYAYSSTNDGIDSNSSITIAGGTVIASGATAPEEGFDCDQGTFAITGGTVVGVGGASSTPTTGSCTQPVIIYGGSCSQGTLFTLQQSTGEHVFSYTAPRTYGQLTMLLSSQSLAVGNTYYIYTGSTLAGTSDFCGLQTGGNVSAQGTSTASATLSSMVTSVGNVAGGMGGGGNMGGPGRRW